jgi:beta-N-acetylhexosaminidase
LGKKIFNIFIITLILAETSLIIFALFFDSGPEEETESVFFMNENPAWADSLLLKMSLDEKIGQLFFIELGNFDSKQLHAIDSTIHENLLGGIKYQNCKATDQLISTNYFQSRSKYPLFIGIEGPLVNQDNYAIPVGPILHANKDTSFLNNYLENFTQVLQYKGIHIDFNNSLNRIDSLNPNSGFSDSLEMVCYVARRFRKKLHNKKIISTLNHSDSLYLVKNQVELDSLVKIKQDYGIDKFFAINLNRDDKNFLLAQPNGFNFSEYYSKIYHFSGILFTTIPDTIDKKTFEKLFKSGIDIFIAQSGHSQAISYIRQFLAEGHISENEINSRVKKILMAKKWAGLENTKFRSAEIALSKIYQPKNRIFSWKIFENAVCLIQNKGEILPFRNLLANQTLIVRYTNSNFSYFEEYLNNYTQAVSSEYKPGGALLKHVLPYSNIIVVLDKKLEIKGNDSTFINELVKISKKKKLIIINFNEAKQIPDLLFAGSVLHVYLNHPISQIVAAQSIAGSIEPKGQFAMISEKIPANPMYKRTDRLQYTIPEAAGFNSIKLARVDSLLKNAIETGATPGCQILAAKNGKVFYYKSFGRHAYNQNQLVKNQDMYDLASITKVAATTVAAMKLHEMGALKMSDSVKSYLKDTTNCTIKNHQLRDFFIHQSGLPADMPILKYIRYMKPGAGRYGTFYSFKKDSLYNIKVADEFFLRKDYLDSIKLSLFGLEWDTTKTYRYSDINFNIIYDLISMKMNEGFVRFLNKHIYLPLQLRSMGFLPLDRFPENRIAPTQDDKFWRKQLLRGMVHDESAAVYGGVAGNAGLFSNANDLAILFQMFLNGGHYGGQRILKKETIEYFTMQQDNSSRGLGFAWNNGFYGHTGFTGCVVWANPDTQMIFILLSNSIHPRVQNEKFRKMEIRNKALELVLKSSF